MDYKAAEGWFVNVWNYNVIPYLHQALRSGRKVLDKMLFFLSSVRTPSSSSKGELSCCHVLVVVKVPCFDMEQDSTQKNTSVY